MRTSPRSLGGGLGLLLGFALTRKFFQALAASRQRRLFHDHDRKAVLDRKAQTAALTNQLSFLERQPSMAGIERAAKDFQEVFANHRSTFALPMSECRGQSYRVRRSFYSDLS